MQVSWIDADEVRDLVAQLAEPAAQDSSAAPDVDTLPDAGGRYGFPLLGDKLTPAAPEPLHEEPAPEPADIEAPIQPDLDRIRERLRAIRDRAQEAGLLSKETPAERAARAPAPAPAVTQPPPPPSAPTPAPAPAFAPAPTPAPAPAPPSFAAAVSPPAQHPPAPLAPPVPPAPPAPSSPPPPQLAVASMPTPPSGDAIVERLNQFARWSATQTGCEELFMLDEHGDLIWGAPTSDDLLICAKLAMNASMRSRGATGAAPASIAPLHVGPGKELQLVACPTIHGNVLVALVNARQTPAAALRETLAGALKA